MNKTFFSGQALVDLLRRECDQLKSRLWIASPYIGSLSAISSILGSKWLNDPKINVRVLTDIDELNRLSRETVETFVKRGEVRTIKGLHAKIYIIDNNALISSANLTGTAFSRRYEVGNFLSSLDSKQLIELFDNWWGEISKDIPTNWSESFSQPRGKDVSVEEIEGKNLPELWKLPKAPPISKQGVAQHFLDYEYFRKIYHDFATKYSDIQRISSDALYLEVDGFLDYLYNHDARPSFKYQRSKGKPLLEPRKLDSEQRSKEIQRYALLFKQWVENGNDIIWRQKSSKLVGNKLESNNITNLQMKDVEEIVGQLNCMKAVPLNKTLFLNNNDIETVRSAWSDLLYGDDELQIRMARCKEKLKWFGSSGVQELLGFFDPEEYPIRNSLCNACLRFFGYDVQ